ncbi:putative bifunctional diguanylate cyclase/phosphodiesterase [Thermodesulfatator atlanticus]|uniref:putative bifunctional diguanylate cyclase/phosphodiesterase n=1 Tax=Thermodesulfatator atlanticus TaxID=501497 RepID=UPI0003B60545|nr:EAL domain-containing protein [Thermodesulfatator atlanticus]
MTAKNIMKCLKKFGFSSPKELNEFQSLADLLDFKEIWMSIYEYVQEDVEAQKILHKILDNPEAYNEFIDRWTSFFRDALRNPFSKEFWARLHHVAYLHYRNGVRLSVFMAALLKIRDLFMDKLEKTDFLALKANLARFFECLGVMLAEEFYYLSIRDLQKSLWLSERQARFLATLREINFFLSAEDLTERDLAQKFCLAMVENLGLSLAWIGRLKGEKLIFVGGFPEDHPRLKEIPQSLNAFRGNLKPYLEKFLSKEPIVINEVSKNENLGSLREFLQKHGLNSIAVVPIHDEKDLYGALFLYHKEKNYFLPDEIQILQEISRDLSVTFKRLKYQKNLEYKLYIDEITSLPNARGFLRSVEKFFRFNGNKNHKLAIIVTDIVHFSEINQILGHIKGDEILKEIARRLTEFLGREGIVGRVGADEFAVTIKFSFLDELSKYLEKLRQTLSRPFEIEKQNIRLNFGLGVSIWPEHGRSPREILAKASSAVRLVSRTPDGGLMFYEAEKAKTSLAKLNLLSRMEKALKNDELELFFQPKINLDSRSISGFEGLLRWRDKERGIVPPGEFIPVLEESQLMIDVGYKVVEQAADFARKIEKETGNPLKISVNLSVRQLKSGNFALNFLEILKRYSIPVERIELEILETMLLEDEAMAEINRLREAGAALVLDDFGTGYSSFRHLFQLGRIGIKIDRTFLEHVPDQRDHVVMLMALVSMARGMDLNVVAEGLETREQLAFITGLGVDEVQGFYFAPPMPAEEALQFLTSFNPELYFWSRKQN